MRVVSDCQGIGGLTLGLDILATHSEDHGRTSAVLDGGVTGQLQQVRGGKEGGDVVSVLLDVVNNFHGKVELRIVGTLQLRIKPKHAS